MDLTKLAYRHEIARRIARAIGIVFILLTVACCGIALAFMYDVIK